MTNAPYNQRGRAGSDIRKEAIDELQTLCGGRRPLLNQETTIMLWTVTIILFVLWIVGLVSSYTLGGWIHILLVLAIIVLIFNLLSGRRAL